MMLLGRLPFIQLSAIACALIAAPAGAEVADSRRVPATPADVQDLLVLGPMRPLVWRLHVTIDGKPFRQVWQARFEDLFDQEDRDRNGKVTIAEADTIVRDMNGSLQDRPKSGAAEATLTSLAGATGTLDRGSLLAHLEKTLPPFSIRRRAVVGRGSALALFGLLDLDNNHQLSAVELDGAEQQLIQRDFNDDRVITSAELILDQAAIAAAADPNGAKDLDATEGPVMLLAGATEPAQVADRLLKYYDRNRDGRLKTQAPEAEISLPAPQLRQLDSDSDGTLDPQELTRVFGGLPDVELQFAMGLARASDNRNRPRSSDPAFRIRKTLLGDYTIKLGEADIKFKRSNRDPQSSDAATFRTVDRDNNGYVDMNEAGQNKIGSVAFATMDADSDGKVIKPEYTTYMDRQNTAASARLQLEISDLGQNLFDLLDFDQDGALAPRELRHARDVLSGHDANGDGVLNGDEIPQSFEFELVRGVDERPENPNRVERGRATRSTATANTSGPLWFRKMDRNNDGDLSPYEFLGPKEAFDKLDANHDGLVDREEAESAGK